MANQKKAYDRLGRNDEQIGWWNAEDNLGWTIEAIDEQQFIVWTFTTQLYLSDSEETFRFFSRLKGSLSPRTSRCTNHICIHGAVLSGCSRTAAVRQYIRQILLTLCLHMNVYTGVIISILAGN